MTITKSGKEKTNGISHVDMGFTHAYSYIYAHAFDLTK